MRQDRRHNEWLDRNARHITFIIKEDCQLRYRYCYLVGKNNLKKMSYEMATKSVDRILDTSELIYGFSGVV
jgi:sulfatase maturation enzyme AslB (radical SAM superfamily)